MPEPGYVGWPLLAAYSVEVWSTAHPVLIIYFHTRTLSILCLSALHLSVGPGHIQLKALDMGFYEVDGMTHVD